MPIEAATAKSADDEHVSDRLGLTMRCEAQLGMRAPHAKPLRGFGGASVLEIVVEHESNAYRAVYTVTFPQAVYVLHAFQKKSKSGHGTPRADIALVRQRLSAATEAHDRSTKG
jgi:phage-related protein